MADRPMIFSAAMVRAMLDGRKTQTRRVLRVQPDDADAILYTEATFPQFCLHGYATFSRRCAPPQHVKLPYAPGDRLWVREAWRVWHEYDEMRPCIIAPSAPVRYPADEPFCPWDSRKRPSIHMPRWASRLTLPVTDVRVQRVREISEADAVAEGADPAPHAVRLLHRNGFAALWNSIHGPDAWDRNEWVAALTFTVDQRNIDAPPLPRVGGA